jgi:hypothetical protein
LDKLTSIFEIYVAVNSAYIISDEFTMTLNTKISGTLTEVKGMLTETQLILDENRKYLENELSGNTNIKSNDITNGLNSKQEDLSSEYEKLGENIHAQIEQASVSPIFRYFCLLSAIYSYMILLAVGYEVDFHSWNDDGLFLFNISSALLFLLFYKRGGTTRFSFLPSGYLYVLLIICLDILLCSCYSFVQMQFKIQCYIDFFNINKIFVTILPITHFIYYFYKASFINKRRLLPKLKIQITEFQTKLNVFTGEIKGNLNAIEMMKVVRRPKNN